MWVRWLATVRSPRNSAAATSRFVGPRRRGRRRGARLRSAPPRACARRSGRARRAPSRPSVAAPSCSKPASAASIASRARPLLPARDAGRCRVQAAREPAERVADVLVLRDRLLQAGERRRRRPLGRRDEAAAPRHVREYPVAGDPRRVRLPDVEDAHRVVDATELEQQLDVVAGPPADARLAPAQLRGAPLGLLEPLQPQRTDLRSRARRARGPPGAAAGGTADCSIASSRARSECSRASSSWPRWTAMTAIGRWSCGISSAVLDRDVVGVSRVSAASSQRPAQNSTHARPQSARALRGSSRSRHSWYSRSSRARASSLFEAGARVFTTACVASRTSWSPPTPPGECWTSAGRSSGRLGFAGEPTRGRPAPRARVRGARRRRTRRRARAPRARGRSRPEALGPCESTVNDRCQGRLEARLSSACSSSSDARSLSSSARRHERLRPQRAVSVSARRSVAIVRARVHSPAVRCARAAASARRCRSSCAVGGVSRRACSRSSAATADAPRSPAGSRRRRAPPRPRHLRCPSRARGGVRGRPGRRRAPRSARGRAGACRRGRGRRPMRAADA